MCVDFELGSVTEIERLRSVAKHIMTEHQRRITHHEFEALLVIDCNSDFWDMQLVSGAVHSAGQKEQRKCWNRIKRKLNLFKYYH